MQVIGYTRVSTDGQATEGVSLEAQRAAITAYCTMRGFTLAQIVEDAGVSGGVPLADRPGGAIVLEAIRGKKAAAVIAYKLDRVFRDASDCLAVTGAWDKGGVSLHLIDLGGQSIDTATAMGRFFLTVMAGAAELERNLIGERTTAAMQHKKATGQRVGAIPYGYRLAADGKSLEAHPAEQAVIAAALELHAAGLSLRTVSAELSRRGFKARNGKEFAAPQIQRMLQAAA